MQSPHDQLFHYTFGQPENAADLLRSTLPAAIAAAIDWRTLTRWDTKLSDAEGDGLYADVLFTVQARGQTAYVFLLLEHKSEQDPDTAYQLLRYVVRIWHRHRSEQERTGLLPPILAVVLHHGRTPWSSARSLRERIDVGGFPEDLAAAVLDRQPDLTSLGGATPRRADSRRGLARSLRRPRQILRMPRGSQHLQPKAGHDWAVAQALRCLSQSRRRSHNLRPPRRCSSHPTSIGSSASHSSGS